MNGLTLFGREYARVRTVVVPVLEWLYTVKSASRRAFAVATGTSMFNHWLVAPGVAVTLLLPSHALTA